jgi:hopanoid biosynthesis associated protein HpnK
LSAASLMVAGPAAAPAVALAKRLPSLRVGLHLVLVEGAPTSPSDRIPDLVDSDGQLRRDMVRLAFDIALRPSVRRQLRSEIAAQFEAFRMTGLPLDHVNAHKHFHVHPLIAREMLSVGRDYGMKALRVPSEPAALVARIDNKPPALSERVMAPWTSLLRSWASRRGLLTPDAVFGLRWTGAITAERLTALLPLLPDGLIEIYTHPATRDDFPGHAPGYRYADELKALTDPDVIAAVRQSRRHLGGYTDVNATATVAPLSA